MEQMRILLVPGTLLQLQPIRQLTSSLVEQQVRNFHKKWKLCFQATSLIWQMVLRPLQHSQLRRKCRPPTVLGPSSHTIRTKRPSMGQMWSSSALGTLLQRQLIRLLMSSSVVQQVKNCHKQWNPCFQPTSLIWQMALRQLQPSHRRQKWRQPKAPGPLSHTIRRKRLLTEQMWSSSALGTLLQRQLIRLLMSSLVVQQVRNCHKKWNPCFHPTSLI